VLRDIWKLLLGVIVAAGLLWYAYDAQDRFRNSIRPPSMAKEPFVPAAQNRWRSFLVIKRPMLIEVSRTDQICKDGLCSYADGVALPRPDLKTIFQDPAQSQVIDGPPGRYRALLARACSHANNVEFCSKTIQTGFRFAACMLNWELQLWTNAYGVDEGTEERPPDYAGATGGYGFKAYASSPEATAACQGATFVVNLPDK
jgi:hypothetical protein